MNKLKINEFSGEIVFRNAGISKNSKATYKTAVKSFQRYLITTDQVEGIESVKGFLESGLKGNLLKQKRVWKSSTYNIKRQALKEYLTEKYKTNLKQLFAIQELFKSIEHKKIEMAILEDDYLTHNQVIEMSQKFTDTTRLFVLALFWSGLRISELVNLQIKDIKLNGKAVLKIRSGKGGKDHTAYLPLDLYYEISKSFRNKNQVYLFETIKAKKYNRMYVTNEIRRQSKRHGRQFSAHTLRHAKAMYLKNEMNLSADLVAKAINHSDPLITLRSYFHGTPTAEMQGISNKSTTSKSNYYFDGLSNIKVQGIYK